MNRLNYRMQMLLMCMWQFVVFARIEFAGVAQVLVVVGHSKVEVFCLRL